MTTTTNDRCAFDHGHGITCDETREGHLYMTHDFVEPGSPPPETDERNFDTQPLTPAEIQETIRYIHRWQVFEHYPKRVLDANRIVVAEAQTEEQAAQIVMEHNNVAALEDALIQARNNAQVFTGAQHLDTARQGLQEIVRQIDAALTTLRRSG